jgi:hypothetical protein
MLGSPARQYSCSGKLFTIVIVYLPARFDGADSRSAGWRFGCRDGGLARRYRPLFS